MKTTKTKKVLTIFLTLVLLLSMTFGQTVYSRGLTLQESEELKTREAELSYSKDLSLPIEKNFALDLSPLDEVKGDEKEEEGEAQIASSYYVQILRPEVISLDEEKLEDQDIRIEKLEDPTDFKNNRSNLGQVYKLDRDNAEDLSGLKKMPFCVLGQVSEEDAIYIWKDSGEILGQYDLDPADFNVDLFVEEKKQEAENHQDKGETGLIDSESSEKILPLLPQELSAMENENDPDDNNENTDPGDPIPAPYSFDKDDPDEEYPSFEEVPLEPGQVKISKQAKRVEDKVNTWNIDLKVQAKDPEQDTAICLVIDRSGSLIGKKFKEIQKEAKNFVNKFLPSESENLEIGIVSFADDVTVDMPLTNNETKLKGVIDNLEANGMTFTQGGVKEARDLLESSTAENKHLVLLSDGVPNKSYPLSEEAKEKIRKNPNLYLEKVSETSDEKQIISGLKEEAFVYNANPTRDIGYNFYFGSLKPEFIYYNHGNNAVSEAKIAKDKGYKLWTIAFEFSEAEKDGKKVLNEMASDNCSFDASIDNLGSAFNSIASQINSSVSKATIVDLMNYDFKKDRGFTISSAVTSKPSHPGPNNPKKPKIIYRNEKDEKEKKAKGIEWEFDNLTEPLEEGSDIKEATLSYEVEIYGEYSDSEIDNIFKTNEDAVLTYNDANGDEQKVHFAKPVVKPTFYKLVKKVEGFTDQDKEVDHKFKINVNRPGKFDKNHTLTIPAGSNELKNETSWLTNLRDVGNYTFEETDAKPDQNYDVEYGFYKTSYKTGKASPSKKSEFNIDQDTKKIALVVTNIKKQPHFKIRKFGFSADEMDDIEGVLGQVNEEANDNYDIRQGSLKVEIKPPEGKTFPGGREAIEIPFDLSEKDERGEYKPHYVQFRTDWPSGDYTLRETEAPVGYKKSPFEYVIQWDNEANEITLKELKLIKGESGELKYYEQGEKALYTIEEGD